MNQRREAFVHRNTEIERDTRRYVEGHRRDIIIGGPRSAYSYFVRHSDGTTIFVYGSRPSKDMEALASVTQ